MRTFLFAFLILVTPLAPVAFTGCTTSQTRVTYNSLFSVGTAVNSAYAAWSDQVVKGTATFNPTVADAYNKFQGAFAVAVSAAQMNSSAIAPQNVLDLANQVYALIKQFSK